MSPKLRLTHYPSPILKGWVSRGGLYEARAKVEQLRRERDRAHLDDSQTILARLEDADKLLCEVEELAEDETAAKTLVWIAERQAVIGILRDLCEEFGSNDWEDDLHLGDVIEKHLAKYLWDR